MGGNSVSKRRTFDENYADNASSDKQPTSSSSSNSSFDKPSTSGSSVNSSKMSSSASEDNSSDDDKPSTSESENSWVNTSSNDVSASENESTESTESPPPCYNDCVDPCLLSVAEVLDALKVKANKSLFRPKSSIKNMKILQRTNMPAYRYQLDTFIERRNVQSHHAPYKKEKIHKGPMPDKWDIDIKPDKAFINENASYVYPRSANITNCSRCDANGVVNCNSCNGAGFRRCSNCHGRGKTVVVLNTVAVSPKQLPVILSAPQPTLRGEYSRQLQLSSQTEDSPDWCVTKEVLEKCPTCYGDGRYKCTTCDKGLVQCSGCEGWKFIINWKTLNVSWVTTTNVFETPREKLGGKRLARENAGGEFLNSKRTTAGETRALKFEGDRSVEINAKAMISNNMKQNGNSQRVLEFRQKIEIIPVVKVCFELKGKEGHFFVYGTERNVFFPKGYPGGCIIS